MYGWIWRSLPGGLRGKLIGSLLLLAGVGTLLWFAAFPAIEPILPNNDGQITDTNEEPVETPTLITASPVASPTTPATPVASPPVATVTITTTGGRPATTPATRPVRPTSPGSR